VNVATTALFGWIGVALILFYSFPPRRAALISVLGGWMFLPPVAKFDLPGVIYTKWVAVSVSTLLGVLLFDAGRLRSFRPRWIDLPILLWCVVCPFIASIANQLGPYDGFQDAANRTLTLGVLYLLGRIYFHDPKGLQDLAVGLFVSGLVYMPLCLLEIRLSPQLHTWVYGYHQHDFAQTWRLGGWRPVVFLSHGLEVGFWMTAATLSGIWLWRSGVVRRILGFPVWIWLCPLGVTTMLCKSTGAIVLLAAGTAALMLSRWPGIRIAAFALLAIPILYAATRTSGNWSGDKLVSLVEKLSPDRAESMGYRFDAENLLARHAMRQPATGWGRWGRNRPGAFDSDVQNVATDGLWVITLGTYGVPGLAAMLGVFLIPPALLFWKLRAPLWSNPWCASAAVLAMLLVLFMIDALMNAMMTPVELLAAGGLSRAVLARSRRPSAAKARPSPEAPEPLPATKPQPES
jgi:hypothetical protein